MALLDVRELSVRFGGGVALDRVSFTVEAGEVVALIGPNGAGKTTLFRMFTGDEKPDDGELRVGPTVELAYVDQTRDALDPDKTVYDEITDGVEAVKVGNREIPARA